MKSRCNKMISQLCTHLLFKENLGQVDRGSGILSDGGDPEDGAVFEGSWARGLGFGGGMSPPVALC